jgi:DNA invertase Pin-like site-specific DNA recombinase
MKKAFAYLRTSSATNVGGDSDVRQREAIKAFAAQAGYEIAGEFYDAAVSGSDALDARPGFTAMLTAINANGCRTIIVESASRFARDLIVQETGYRQLRGGKNPIELIAADSPEAFVHDTPTARLVRQVLGAVSEFEKAALVAKLKGARDRRARETGKRCGGIASHAETRPDVVAVARQLGSAGMSLRKISAELATRGFLNDRGQPFNAKSVRAML